MALFVETDPSFFVVGGEANRKEEWERITGWSPEYGASLLDLVSSAHAGTLQALCSSPESGGAAHLALAGGDLVVTRNGDAGFHAVLMPRTAVAPTDSHAEAATALSRLQAVLASSVDLDRSVGDRSQIYMRAMENLSAAIRFETGSIQLLDGDELVIVAGFGFPPEAPVEGLRFPLDPRFPNGRVMNGARALALDDIRVDFPHFLVEKGQYRSGHIRSWLGVPLTEHGKAFGIISMDRTSVDPFSADEVELAQGLANHAAVTLANTTAYELLQEANTAQKSLLREIHHRVKNSLQLILSLLDVERSDPERRSAEDVLTDTHRRVHALATVHDHIVNPGFSDDVEMAAFIRDVVHGAAERTEGVVVAIDAPESMPVDLQIAVPLGIIASEMVVTIIDREHRRSWQRSTTVHVGVGRGDDGTIELAIDLGRPLDEKIDAVPTVVATLADQLNAHCAWSTLAGVDRWTVTLAG